VKPIVILFGLAAKDKAWERGVRTVMAMILFVTSLLLLSGCVGGAGDAESTPEQSTTAQSLEYWTPFSGGDNRFMTEMVERFNSEHPEIQVTQTNSRLDDYYQRLRTTILAGNAPDVAVIHATSLPQFVQNGYIEDITKPAKELGLDWSGLNANMLEATVYEGRNFAVPLDTHALVMFYNKTYLEAAGLLDADGKPIVGAGAEGFESFLTRIASAIPAGVAPMAQPSTRIDSVWLWWSLYNQMEGGGTFYNESFTAAELDNPLALEALTFVDGLYAKGLIPPDINDAFKLFYEGKAAVLITGMWGTGAFENAKDLDFGVVPVPVLYDKPAVWGDSHTLTIPTKHGMTDEKRKAILTFTKWMVDHGELWANAGHVPSQTSVVESNVFKALPYRSDYAATADDVAYWPRHMRQWSMVEILIREFERMIYNRQTPEETLRNVNDAINADLST
jgi:multiple sugar transport system substrate-binding protein